MASLQRPEYLASSIPHPSQTQVDRGYGGSVPMTATTDFGSAPNHLDPSSIAQSPNGRFNEEWDASQRGSSIIDGPAYRSNSAMSQGDTLIPSRGGTLKKKVSVKRGGSMKRSGSRRSSRAGSVRSLALHSGSQEDDMHSAFFSPVPTTGNPTEILANRFQAWRKVLKDLITYYREIQGSYEQKAKSLLKVSNVVNNIATPPVFLTSGGLDDAFGILRSYHKQAIQEANKAKEIENDVILALTGLRSDLSQKIKEIKNLSGDFKNSVEKEMDATRKAVHHLQEALGRAEADPSSTGKDDPYLLRLQADHQLERQIDEENYLHQAYLNLETSGTELEAIVVGEIQKSYNAYAGILKREADDAYSTVEELRTGPIAMPKDHEWKHFVENDEHFVDPRVPIRDAQNVTYPGRDNELATEVRAGLLERKSKYLKSYTAGWYVLSPTHLHEFKSADKNQAPIMSLYLPEQKLGSHSTGTGSSNKFMLKGRQTGSMHRGHTWVLRAESHDTMMAWYEDIKTLTEKSPQERDAFVRQHARSVSGTLQRANSVSSDGAMDDEDEEPFSATNSSIAAKKEEAYSKRPQPGGRFPSDLQVNTQRGLQAPLSPSSGSSEFGGFQNDHGVAATSSPAGGNSYFGSETHPGMNGHVQPTKAEQLNHYAQEDGVNPYTYEPIHQNHNQEWYQNPGASAGAAGVGGAALEAARAAAYNHERQPKEEPVTESERYEQQAAREAQEMAAPDMDIESRRLAHRQLANAEAAQIASPDVNTVAFNANQRHPVPLDSVVATDNNGDHIHSPSAADGYTHSGINQDGSASLESESHMQKILDPLTTDLPRPAFSSGQKYDSATSISQLHIPGEFPGGR